MTDRKRGYEKAAKRYKKVPRATAVIWKTLMIAEKRFRKLHAPHRMKEVSPGTRYVDGVRVSTHTNWKPAA